MRPEGLVQGVLAVRDLIINHTSSEADFWRAFDLHGGIDCERFRKLPIKLFRLIQKREVALVYNASMHALYLSIQCAKVLIVNPDHGIQWHEMARIFPSGERVEKEYGHTVRETKKYDENFETCAVRGLTNELGNAWRRLGIDPPEARDLRLLTPGSPDPDIEESVTWPGITTWRHYSFYELHLKQYLGFRKTEVGERFQYKDRDDEKRKSPDDMIIELGATPMLSRG